MVAPEQLVYKYRSGAERPLKEGDYLAGLMKNFYPSGREKRSQGGEDRSEKERFERDIKLLSSKHE